MQGSTSPIVQSPAGSRLWRPAAQRNLRNSWSKILGQRAAWISASSKAFTIASSLINAHLNLRYMSTINLGVLKEMDGICDKSHAKLFRQQEEYLCNLRSCYRDLVNAVVHMSNASMSMRTYMKRSAGSPLMEFSNDSGLDGDSGDGGGIAIFSALPLQYFENLGEELVEMFVSELKVKRLLVVEFLSIVYNEAEEAIPCTRTSWNEEIYPGEFDSVKNLNNFFALDTSALHLGLDVLEIGDNVLGLSKGQPRREVLQVYLTAWLAEVNINNFRIEEVIAMVGEEMQITLV